MAVKTYSKRVHSIVQLSPHFKVREFACNDGSDAVLIDERLVKLLEQIRVYARASVNITSAYRTASYNKRIGGAANSQHTKGTAADITTAGRTPAQIAKFAQAIGAGGVGLYTAQKFVHVDVRNGKSYWKNTGNGDKTVSGHGGACPYSKPSSTAKRGSKGNGVRWVQWWLQLWGYSVGVDGVFGAKTEDAVKQFQKSLGIEVDGKVGPQTKNAFMGVL